MPKEFNTRPKRKVAAVRSGRARIDDNPTWTAADFARAKPAAEVLPADLVAVLPKRKPGQRGPQKSPTKELVSIRVNREVLDHFRASGPRWQTRMNEVLASAMQAGVGARVSSKSRAALVGASSLKKRKSG